MVLNGYEEKYVLNITLDIITKNSMFLDDFTVNLGLFHFIPLISV